MSNFYNRHIHLILFIVFCSIIVILFFFNDTATTEIYTLSLHDALPIFFFDAEVAPRPGRRAHRRAVERRERVPHAGTDRKSTRLNSSHMSISYAVFCLKKKKKQTTT